MRWEKFSNVKLFMKFMCLIKTQRLTEESLFHPSSVQLELFVAFTEIIDFANTVECDEIWQNS